MGLFSWIAMTGVFLLVKRITSEKLSCNLFTAAIAAAILFIFNFGYVTLLSLKVHPILLHIFGETGSAIVWFGAWLTALPLTTFFVILACSLLLPGFRVNTFPQKKRDVDALVKGIKSPELEKQLRTILAKPRKASNAEILGDLLTCTVIFAGLFSLIGVLGPFFGSIAMYLLFTFLDIKATPHSNRRGAYDPWKDVFNRHNPTNRINPLSPYHPSRQSSRRRY